MLGMYLIIISMASLLIMNYKMVLVGVGLVLHMMSVNCLFRDMIVMEMEDYLNMNSREHS